MVKFRFLTRALGALALVISLSQCALAQSTTQKTERDIKRSGLAFESLAGQTVAVMPLTHIVRDTALKDSALMAPRAEVQAWADSLLGELLLETAPQVTWMLPPELQKVARKGAGMIPEPDRMGPSVMRSDRLTQVPDPLRSNLRTLMALAGGRYVFIPASIYFDRDLDGAIRATVYAVLADTRTGQVAWRAKNAVGAGANRDGALRAALMTFLPDESAP
ncbi:MAG: hypothetical protein OEW44_00835 [Gemmatimonadota bacterium]|jgi:hypothetical protein|nr:hypothetical protein [Gemmatimonadota bacterium]